MANKKITELTAATSAGADDLLAIVQGGETKKITAENFLNATGISKKYLATINQTGTDAPTVTVFKNTLGGEIIFTRDDVGYYLGTLIGAFETGKTYIKINNWTGFGQLATRGYFTAGTDNPDAMYINCGRFEAVPELILNASDNMLFAGYSWIEIEVFP